MRWSQAYVPTLRQDPADAEAASHRLLVRAGFVRQLMAGHYMLLPLAVRVRAKIIEVIRQEMDRIGGQELLLPAMHPAEVWQRSGRWEVMGEELFRVRDRKGADVALGMTHERSSPPWPWSCAPTPTCPRSGASSRPSSGTSPAPGVG